MRMMRKITKKILFSILLIFALLFVGTRVAGFKPYSVETESMTPEYPVDTLIYVREVQFDKLSEGDVITYVNQSGSTVTHRIVSIDKNDKSVRTKGDANEFEDIQSVFEENIVGKVYFGIPYVGKISNVITGIARIFLKERSSVNE